MIQQCDSFNVHLPLDMSDKGVTCVAQGSTWKTWRVGCENFGCLSPLSLRNKGLSMRSSQARQLWSSLWLVRASVEFCQARSVHSIWVYLGISGSTMVNPDSPSLDQWRAISDLGCKAGAQTAPLERTGTIGLLCVRQRSGSGCEEMGEGGIDLRSWRMPMQVQELHKYWRWIC